MQKPLNCSVFIVVYFFENFRKNITVVKKFTAHTEFNAGKREFVATCGEEHSTVRELVCCCNRAFRFIPILCRYCGFDEVKNFLQISDITNFHKLSNYS